MRRDACRRQGYAAGDVRSRFGPPDNALGAFAWAALQLPRAVLWQVRERELRRHALAPLVVTFLVGLGLVAAAVLGAGPLEALLLRRGEGLGASLAWVAGRVVLTAGLVALAVLLTWHLQSAIASAWLERMALYVQREVTGAAPAPAVGALAVAWQAARGVLPRVKALVAWALAAGVSGALVLVPVAGPVLAVAGQALVGATFLAHAVVTDNRARLGLPRWLLVRQPALLSGLALALAPLTLVPPLLFVASGPVAIAGALVALGAQRRGALRAGAGGRAPGDEGVGADAASPPKGDSSAP